MKYGYFVDEAREYVITNPKTPAKWINYIGNLTFGGFVDHTGGALVCKGDPSLKDKIGTSPFFVPTLDDYDSFECRVGLGYNKIVSVFCGVKTECTIFIPQDAQVEIRDITVTNVSGGPLDIDVVPVLEYTHPDAVKQFTPYNRVREVNEPVRSGLRELIDFARVDGRPAFIFVNNRLEGNSPGTIIAITD